MVVLEAFYHALPVIAGNAGGMKDIVEHVGSGILVDGSEILQIRQAICTYLSRERIREDIEKIGGSLMDYTDTYQAAHFLQMYGQLMLE